MLRGCASAREDSHCTGKDGLFVLHCRVTLMSLGSRAITGGMMDTEGAVIQYTERQYLTTGMLAYIILFTLT